MWVERSRRNLSCFTLNVVEGSEAEGYNFRMVDELGGGEERRGNNDLEYPYEYFDAQVQFAKKWSELMGVSFAEALRTKTAIDRRLTEGERNVVLPELMKGVESNPEAASKLIYDRYLSQPQSKYKPPTNHLEDGVHFGFFAFDYYPQNIRNDGKNTVKVHFINSSRGEKSGLAADFLPQRKADLKRMFDFIKERHPEAQEVIGGSWLYNLPAYRDSFPPEFTQNMKRLVPLELGFQFPNAVPDMALTGNSVWGQFVDRRGWVRGDSYSRFINNVNVAKTPKELVDAFPERTFQPKAPIALFHNWKPSP